VKLRLIVPLVLLAACATATNDASEPGLSLSASPAIVSAGETITLTLSNQSAWPIGYNLCTSALEREAGTGWEPVPEDRICTMELRMLDPGSTSEQQIQLPATMPAGSYRYTANVEDRGSMEPISTAAFEVR
jgi:hypothetical protein